jgi:hypothetical protein
MHNPRKIVKVSPVLFTSVSQTFDDFCRQKCFTSPCLAKNKQVMATQSKLVCLKLVFVHFSSVIYGFTRLHMWFLKYSGKNIRSASGFFIAGNPFIKIPAPWLGNPSVFYTFYLVYIWHCRIKLFLRHLPNCPCSNFSLYVDWNFDFSSNHSIIYFSVWISFWTVIYHQIISMFPYSDGRCAIFTK